jgi:hypothetical protein
VQTQADPKLNDKDSGFKQLAVELIALGQWLEQEEILYGAVSIGTAWQFGLLDPTRKQMIQDLNLYAVPVNLETVLRILLGILGRAGEEFPLL